MWPMAFSPSSSHDSPPSDQELVKAYIQGQPQAFVQLIERYRLELFHFLLRFLNDPSAADDVFQETFLQIHVSIDSFDLSRPFKPWLMTIAANKARDYLRRNRRQNSQLSLTVTDRDSADGTSEIDLMDLNLPTPADAAEQSELQQMVRQMIAQLPTNLREILLLAYFQQIPYKEIAEQLGIPLGTVKSRLHAAVGTFAQMWKQRHSTSPPPNPSKS